MDDPPKGALVAVRDRREKVIAILCEGYATDLISDSEFENRLDSAHQTTDLVALDKLVADLEGLDKRPEVALATLPEARAMNLTRPKTKNVVAIFGGVSRTGEWTAPQKLRAIAVLGGIELDFREAILPAGVTEVQIYTLIGGADVIVPPGVTVECDGIAILGGFETVGRVSSGQVQSRAVLRITGISALGGVSVSTRLPGESSRQAKRRLKREDKARQKARDKATKLLGA